MSRTCLRVHMTALAAALLATGCIDTGTETTEETKLLGVVTAKAANAPMSAIFSHASTGEPVAAPVSVTLLGSAAAHVIDTAGNPTTQFTVTNGMLHFALADGVDPATTPLELTLVAKADGFLTTSQTLTLASTDGAQARIAMVELANPPTGTVVKSAFFANAVDISGATNLVMEVTTAADMITGGSGTISIPAGTRITTKTGAPLTGDVTVDVVYHNNTSLESLAAFPGGLFSSVKKSDGSNAVGNFISGGFVSVEVTDSNGNKGEQFDQPITFTASVPEATVNPETGAPVKGGDTIPIWSYDTDTGEWTEEGLATITVQASAPSFRAGSATHVATLGATFQANHLSYFNMDWHITPKCAPYIDIPGWAGYGIDVSAEIIGYYSGGQRIYDGSVQVANLPMNYPLRFTARHEGVEIGRVEKTIPNDGSCTSAANNPYRINMPTSSLPPQAAQLDIRVKSAQCPHLDLSVPRNTYIAYRKAGVASYWNQWGFLPLQFNSDGTVSFNLQVIPGADYQFFYYTYGYIPYNGSDRWFRHYGFETVTIPASVTSTSKTFDLSVMCDTIESRLGF